MAVRVVVSLSVEFDVVVVVKFEEMVAVVLVFVA